MIGRLPPLNACRAFEAAARLGSFSRAAEELNVTAGAVSHQVKVLEGWIGRQLFRRRTNSVVLTDAARSLAPAINEALERLALGVEGLQGTGGAMPLTVSAQPDFALKWLIPRLPRFAALYPAIELRLVTGVPGARFGQGGYRPGRALPRPCGSRERRCAGRDRGAAPRRSPAAGRSDPDCKSGAVPARSPACPGRVAGLHASARAERAGRLAPLAGRGRGARRRRRARPEIRQLRPDERGGGAGLGRGARPGGVHRRRPCQRPSGRPLRAAALGTPLVVPADRTRPARSPGSRHFGPGCCTKAGAEPPDHSTGDHSTNA